MVDNSLGVSANAGSNSLHFDQYIIERPSIASLPDELLLNIFGQLDGLPPSQANVSLYDEPRLDITRSHVKDLKAISRVSKRWRQAVVPLLFRHATFEFNTDRGNFLQRDLNAFLEFVVRSQLRNYITTFALVCRIKEFHGIYASNPSKVFANVWASIFSHIDSDTLLIVAPVEALSLLTGCSIYEEDSWCFLAPCHYLRLEKSASKELDIRPPTETYNTPRRTPKEDKPTGSALSSGSVLGATTAQVEAESSQAGKTDLLPPGKSPLNAAKSEANTFADAEVLFSRPWSKLLLNEGSFIRAFATYEFWERQPPSILSCLLGTPTERALFPPTIRDLEYIAIFPMEPHFSNITTKFPRVDRVYVQLVPRNDILQDSAKMAQVDAEDLWMERNRCYAVLMRELFNAPPVGNFKHLQTFESGDAADKDAWSMAVEYVKRAGNGWQVAGEGVFIRDVQDLPVGSDNVEEADGLDGSAFEGALTRWAWNGVTKLPVSAQPLYDRPLGPAN